MSKKLISLIIPAYNEEECVEELFNRLVKVFATEDKYNFEVVIVENGSIDSTWTNFKRLLRRTADLRF